MNIVLYDFSKRKNSTASPSSAGTDFTVTLKSGCSIIKPYMDFRENPSAYNYAYIPDFSRYYYITDIIWENGIWAVNMDVDVLSSWAAYIKGTTAQVIFSSSNYNLDLIDNRIAASGRIIRNTVSIPFQGALSGQQIVPSGTFCLTALDDTGIWATGAATTYFMTYQQMQAFAQELINPTTWEGIKQFFDNPMDAIIDCYYLPLDISAYVSLTVDRNIKIGSYEFPTATAKSALSTNMANKAVHTTIDIEWPYDDFRRMSPFTTLEMFIPFCGSQSISPESCYQQTQLLLDYGVDVTTGAVQAICYLKETVLQEWSGNCRVQLPIGQSQSRVDAILGTAGGLVTAAGGVVTGNVALGATGVLSAISSAISPTSQKTMAGMGGSILGAVLGNDIMRWQQIRLSVTSHESSTSPSAIRSTIGNVNGAVVNLGSLSGYVQTQDASVSCPATENEITMINQMLDGGIYL